MQINIFFVTRRYRYFPYFKKIIPWYYTPSNSFENFPSNNKTNIQFHIQISIKISHYNSARLNEGVASSLTETEKIFVSVHATTTLIDISLTPTTFWCYLFSIRLMSPINFGIGDIHTRITRLFSLFWCVHYEWSSRVLTRDCGGGDGKCETDLGLQWQTQKIFFVLD
jgi:hypothetical protein